MTRDLLILPAAANDLANAASWCERQRVGLGHDFLGEFLAAADRIRNSPEAYPVLHRSTRRAMMRRFPFGIFYRVEPAAIMIVAILHASRAPQRWKTRL